MDPKLLASILVGKSILLLSRLLKLGGGSAAPGLYALKICPDLISKLSPKIPKTIIITGTNGKTTTSRLLAHFAEKQGFKVLRNNTGSNLERGIASALIAYYPLFTINHKPDLAIWELDEAAFNTVTQKAKPDLIVFLNAFRDQLDRYGEVDTVIKKWCQTLEKIEAKTTVLINGDDKNLLQLKKYCPGKVEFFGVKDYKIEGEKVIKKAENEKLNLEAIDVKENGLSGTSFNVNQTQINLNLAGIFNIYNYLASFAAATNLGLDQNQIINSLKNFSPAFGRMEKINLKGKEGHIFLIKNPVGATQIFQTITKDLKEDDCLLLALNDNFADGTDVSWIWDIELEQFKSQKSKVKIICSGKRAFDLALRLKYAGFDTKQININLDLNKAFQEAQIGLKGRLFILPTYTCLLELQKILAKNKIKKEYWQE